MPNKTAEQAEARERLRKLAVIWWAYNVEMDAKQWLIDHPKHTKEDVAAIQDCIKRAKACSYWEWHRGSRIMWFRLPEEFQAFFRDGSKLFHVGPTPIGLTRNSPSESRAAEIEARKKIFKLSYQGYIETGFVDLVQGHFQL